MIATLSGVVAEKLGDIVVIEAGGVGYGILVSTEDYGNLSPGKQAKVYVYEHLREDMHDLYGFSKLESKQLFVLLLSVNGVGPKMALNLLSLGALGDLRSAIAGGDVKFLTTANGVGKKVAERIVVDLKEKVGVVADDSATSFLNAPSSADEAMQALMALGYSAQDAGLALSKVDAGLSTEDRIKLALKGA
jgi:Holliday junction DNA helicase RuvA